ncbi:MAG: hypothetical protein IPL53_15150 [Ignavibacteria bacterium]|nr:hypothetical protein [Ignavibacteria bacterium]
MDFFNKLSPKELARFKKFILSPFFNSNKTVMKLFKYLEPEYPNVKEVKYVKKKIAFAIYGDKPVSDTSIRKLLSDFKKLYYKFLVQYEWDTKKLRNYSTLIDLLVTKNLVKDISSKFNEYGKVFNRQLLKNESYYLNKREALRVISSYTLINLRKNDKLNFQKSTLNLDYFYIFSKIETFMDYLVIERFYNNKFSFPREMYKEVMSYIERNKNHFYKYHHFLYTRYLVLKCFTNYDDKAFQELIVYFEKNRKFFKNELLSNYFNYVLFYHREKMHFLKITENGNKDLFANAFSLIKYLFTKNNLEHILFRGWLTIDLYHEAVLIGLFMHDFEWASNFIEKYKKLLFYKNRDDEYNLAKSSYNLFLKNYDEAIRYLNLVSYKSSLYHYYSKVLLLKIFYETGNFKGIKIELSNLRLFIKRNSDLKDKNKKELTKFIRYLKNLIKLSNENTFTINVEAHKLKKEIEDANFFNFELLWLYEKINELLISNCQEKQIVLPLDNKSN